MLLHLQATAALEGLSVPTRDWLRTTPAQPHLGPMRRLQRMTTELPPEVLQDPRHSSAGHQI
jgi:hypothetical protein